MKIMLLTAGTRGDVEPFAVLARAAMARGHRVRLAVPDNPGADLTGLEIASLHLDFARLITDQGVSPRAAAAALKTVIRPALERLLCAAVEHTLAFDPDVVVYHPKVLSAPIVAASMGVPSVIVETVPVLTPTREFPAPYAASVNLGPLNRATYRAGGVATLMFRRELDASLKMLPAGTQRKAAPYRSLVPVSPQLLPRPKDWPPTVHLTGYWAGQPAAADADVELEEFMDRGKFVYAGFGSMKAGDAKERGEVIIEAARRNALNALVITGWGGLDPARDAGNGVLIRESVDHHRVLPRASAAIHHGGAGTVHAVARAGIPSVVVPFIADQPFWANLLHRRGLAPEPIPYRKLTVARLTEALGQIGNHRDRAIHIGKLIRQEDGAAVAVDILEALAGKA